MRKLFKHRIVFVLSTVALLMGISACEDLLEQKPPSDGQNLLPDVAIETAEDLQEVLTSPYDVLANTHEQGYC
jgi:hypothetical protein